MRIKSSIQILGMAVCVFAAFTTANGQSADTRGIPTATPSAAGNVDPHVVVEKEILNELRQIRALLQQQQHAPQAAAAAPAPVPEKTTVSAAGFEIGSEGAPITIVEFADYQCPYCRQFHNSVFNRLKKDYIDTGKVRFVSRDLPLDFHPNALGAAQAARCAGDQSQYWQMRDAMIQHSDKLQAEALSTYATQLGLDMPRFNSCMAKQTYSASIHQDLEDANAVGISGTPSFVVGRTAGSSISGELLVGNQPYETFERVIARSAY